MSDGLRIVLPMISVVVFTVCVIMLKVWIEQEDDE